MPAQPAPDRPAAALANVSGAIFVIAGLAKFVLDGGELDAFRRFGLPAPEAFVVAAGVIEVGGGVLLLLRRHVVAAATVLAATMAVAVVVSGFGAGDVIPSLTLAPALLAAMLFLLVRQAASARSTANAPSP
jgi:uncharacterized membrane protein YphA (DoxX/SURF4 family)